MAVKPIIAYTLMNTKGQKLLMQLGIDEDSPILETRRWRFFGQHIPMPVHSGQWFNGFSLKTMLDWLAANGGWHLVATVYLKSGLAVMYDLSINDDEEPVPEEAPIESKMKQHELDEDFVNFTIYQMWQAGLKARAMRLYQKLYGLDISTAGNAVRDIVNQLNDE